MDYLTVAMTRDYVEILEILKQIPEEERQKIPNEEIAFFEKHKDLTYKFKLDPDIEISEQKISRGTYALLVDLYQRYIATPEERKLIDNILDLNEQKAINKAKESANIAKETESVEHNIPEIKQNLTVIKEESFFKRCINKIKSFFRIKGE